MVLMILQDHVIKGSYDFKKNAILPSLVAKVTLVVEML